MKDFRVIIQSRLSSSRLPGKGLLPIVGYPTVILCALRAMNIGAEVIVATSTDLSDDLTAAALEQSGTKYFRGPLDDVLARYYLTTQDLEPGSIVVRLTADNLFPDGNFVEQFVNQLRERHLSYLGTHYPFDGLPYGLTAEAFTVDVLREAQSSTDSSFDREHVTPWIIRKYAKEFFHPPEHTKDWGHLRCTMDTFDDYLRLNKVFQNIEDPVHVPWVTLCEKLATLPGEPAGRVPYRLKNGALQSQMTLGTVQLGLNYGVANKTGQPSAAEAKAIVRQAIAHGITTIDCARGYGEAEERLEGALKGGFAERVHVVTKLDPLPNLDDYSSEASLRAAVDASVFRSCRELGMPKLQTLLLHRWQHRGVADGVIWSRLLELRDMGIIERLGVSVQTPAESAEALADPEVKHIQLPYNLLDWRWKAQGIDRLAETRPDVIIHARSALLQGLLTDSLLSWPNVDRNTAQRLNAQLDRLVKKLGRESRADLCFAYVRSQAWIDSVVVGVERLDQLMENIQLFCKPPLSQEEVFFVESMQDKVPVKLLDPAKWQ
jgi:spore coat polysaccharide biosynthesis protein SpsF